MTQLKDSSSSQAAQLDAGAAVRDDDERNREDENVNQNQSWWGGQSAQLTVAIHEARNRDDRGMPSFAGYKPPTRTEMEKIMENFETMQQFTAWVEGFRRDNRQASIKKPKAAYYFMARDAEHEAPQIRAALLAAAIDSARPCPTCNDSGIGVYAEDALKWRADRNLAPIETVLITGFNCSCARGRDADEEAIVEEETRQCSERNASAEDRFFLPSRRNCKTCSNLGCVITGADSPECAIEWCSCLAGKYALKARGLEWAVSESRRLRAEAVERERKRREENARSVRLLQEIRDKQRSRAEKRQSGELMPAAQLFIRSQEDFDLLLEQERRRSVSRERGANRFETETRSV